MYVFYGIVITCVLSCDSIKKFDDDDVIRRVTVPRARVRCGAIYGSAFWVGCLKAFSVSVSAVSYVKKIQMFGLFIMFLGRLTTALLQFIVSIILISVGGRHLSRGRNRVAGSTI